MTADIALVGAQRPEVQEALEREFTVHDVYQTPDMMAALQPIADRIRVVATNAMAGVPAAVIDALPNLELIAIMGVGLEKTDIERAKERGVTVTTTPVLYDDVSDLGIILAMNACRRIVQADRFVRSGDWLKGRYPPATKFSGKRAGILGSRSHRQGAGQTSRGLRHGDRLLRSIANGGVCLSELRFGRGAGCLFGYSVSCRSRWPGQWPYRDR